MKRKKKNAGLPMSIYHSSLSTYHSSLSLRKQAQGSKLYGVALSVHSLVGYSA
jgi:hypothetical protein